MCAIHGLAFRPASEAGRPWTGGAPAPSSRGSRMSRGPRVMAHWLSQGFPHVAPLLRRRAPPAAETAAVALVPPTPQLPGRARARRERPGGLRPSPQRGRGGAQAAAPFKPVQRRPRLRALSVCRSPRLLGFARFGARSFLPLLLAGIWILILDRVVLLILVSTNLLQRRLWHSLASPSVVSLLSCGMP